MNAVAIRRLRLGTYWWSAGVLLAVTILLGSLVTPSDLPGFMHVSDKLVHFAGYGGLCFWFAGLLDRDHYPALAVLLVAFGAAIEGMQYVMGYGRSADWRDIIANSAGIATSLALAYAGLGAWMFYVERRLGLS